MTGSIQNQAGPGVGPTSSPTEGNLVVAALYHFAPLENRENLRSELKSLMTQEGIKGSLLLASEGINGTVCGSRVSIDRLLERLRQLPGFANLEHKESFHSGQAFRRAKVRLKKEAVTFKRQHECVGDPGIYIEAADWNHLIQQPGVLVLDTRNAFEVEMGTFAGAVDPRVKSFSQLADFTEANLDPGKHPRIATFCTGGIRCEKFTRFLKAKGFEEVYQLKGGILKYLETIPPEESLWRGACFVFDERVALGHGLVPVDPQSPSASPVG